MRTLGILFTLSFALSAASLFAQSRYYNSATLGMGGGGTAFIDSYHANFLNPANLMLDDGRKPNTSIGLAAVGGRVGGTFVNFSVYNEYLTNNLTIDGQTRVDMLDEWFGTDINNTRKMGNTLNTVPVGFSSRQKQSAFSLATRVRMIQDITLNRGFMEVAFYGADSDQFSDMVPVDFSYSNLSFAEISVGYAREIRLPFTGLIEALPFINSMKLYAGVAPKYIVGLQSAQIDFNSNFQVAPVSAGSNGGITHDFSYAANVYGDIATIMSDFADERQSNPDAQLDFDYSGSDLGTIGSGFGMDLGLTAELDVSLPVLNFFGKNQKLRVAMSVTDLGSVSYKSNPKSISASGTVNIDGEVGNQDIGDYYDILADSLQDDVYLNFEARDGSSTKYELPGMYNFGAALTVGKLTTTLDYGFGFNDLGTNSRRSALTLGAQYRFFGFIPVRAGTRIGGYSGAAYSAGIGLDFKVFEFTVAASVVGNSRNNGSSVTTAFSGLVFRF